jgi:hypothetical protein
MQSVADNNASNNGATPATGRDETGTTPTYSIARFTRATDKQPQAAELTWRELAELCTRHDHRPNKDGALFSPTLYADGATRGKAGVLFVSCLVLDFDNGIATGALKAKWKAAGYAYALHSSHSSTPDFPKWRAIFPLAAPVPGDEWPRVWRKLAAFIGGDFVDTVCKDASRIYYLPSCPPEYSGNAFAEIHDGAPLDVAAVPDLPDETQQRAPIERTTAPASFNGAAPGDRYRDQAIAGELAALQNASEGERNKTLNQTAFRLGQFVGAGRYSRADAEYELLHAATATGLPGGEAQRTIKSGLDAGEHEPEYEGINPTPRVAHIGPDFARSSIARNLPSSNTDNAHPIRPEKEEEPRRRFILDTAEALKNRPDPEYITEGLLVENTLSMIMGPHGCFKSFLAVDLAAHIDTGMAWHGRAVKQLPVLYVSAEGSGGLGKRIRAWETRYQIELSSSFRILTEAANMLLGGAGGDVELLIAAINDLPENERPGFIVIDTLARCMVGGDENSARDMGLFIAGADRLRRATGAHVLIIHHANKEGGTRGSTALPGAVDTQIDAKKEGDNLILTCGKQKDAEEFRPIVMAKRVVEFGLGQSSLIFEQIENHGARADEANANRQTVLDVLGAHEPEGLRASEWQEKCENKGIKKRTFYNHRDALQADGKVEKSNGVYHVVGSNPNGTRQPESPEVQVGANQVQMHQNAPAEMGKQAKCNLVHTPVRSAPLALALAPTVGSSNGTPEGLVQIAPNGKAASEPYTADDEVTL